MGKSVTSMSSHLSLKNQTGQLCNTAGWGLLHSEGGILTPLSPFDSIVLVGAKKEGVLNY